MKECSKSIQRRLHTPAFINRYFCGDGVDIGGKPDPLNLYKQLFCRMNSCRTWDLEDGDAQFMAGIPDNYFDFVHSSHCLEHMREPAEALKNWLRILKPGGYAVISVPDEDMYEQGQWPSIFNKDHKWTFTIAKASSWSPVSINILDLVRSCEDIAELVQLARLEDSWRQIDALYDQTITPVGECGIEFVLRKRSEDKPLLEVPDKEMRIHFNQYMDDKRTIRNGNLGVPPFTNESPLQKNNAD